MLNIKILLKCLIVAQILILLIVYYIEHVMHIYACSLCKYQRVPFFVNIILLSFLILDKARFNRLFYILLVSIIINVGISFYHIGIEYKFFTESEACITKDTPENTKDLLNVLINQEKQGCSKVNFKLFNFSLSELNFLINVVFLVICVHIIRNEKKQKN